MNVDDYADATQLLQIHIENLGPYVRQIRRDIYAAAIIGAIVARKESTDLGAIVWAFTKADQLLTYADANPEGQS